jgi:predicted DNA-binding transcriptional regulator AlpA
VARGLEAQWEQRLKDLNAAEAELERREHLRPRQLNSEQREAIRCLGADLKSVWSAPTTTDRDRKELLRTLLDEVSVGVERDDAKAHLSLRWRGGAITEIDVNLKRHHEPTIRTDEDTIELVRRLAVHYSDALIAGILNRQGRRTATGERFTANRVGGLRRYWEIARFESPSTPSEGELLTVKKAANALGLAPSTLHRWLADGFIAGEQLTPGAPWRIRITDEVRARFVEEEPEGYLPMWEAMKRLGVSRQTVLQRVKRGELQAIHLNRGKRKGLRIKVFESEPSLFESSS